ncbi:MAG: hypothetical protein COC12_07165 [Rhodobacteraceae bacterium]|nr:MAG: hypothetical protein COC12_07165 [Paracoccaceae bacterium]
MERQMTCKSLALAAAFTLTAGFSLAEDITVGTLVLKDPYAFETAKTARAGGAFVRIVNTGSDPDRLLDVRADYPKVQVHETIEKDGIARMQPAGEIDIPAGGMIELKPGGYHIMFMGLKGAQRFSVGETVEATLVFEQAGEVTIDFPVRKRTGGKADMGQMGTMEQGNNASN